MRPQLGRQQRSSCWCCCLGRCATCLIVTAFALLVLGVHFWIAPLPLAVYPSSLSQSLVGNSSPLARQASNEATLRLFKEAIRSGQEVPVATPQPGQLAKRLAQQGDRLVHQLGWPKPKVLPRKWQPISAGILHQRRRTGSGGAAWRKAAAATSDLAEQQRKAINQLVGTDPSSLPGPGAGRFGMVSHTHTEDILGYFDDPAEGNNTEAAIPSVFRGGRDPAEAALAEVWLFGLIWADSQGAANLMRHWFQHYSSKGIQPSSMILLLHGNSNSTTAEEELTGVKALLDERGVFYRHWSDEYSAEGHLKLKLELLREKVTNLTDWIVVASGEEFHDISTIGPSFPEALRRVATAKANWVLGMLVDRVATDGILPAVAPEPSMAEQFPLQCHLTKQRLLGFVWRAVAFRAFWRPNAGNNYIVTPDRARPYFAGIHVPGNSPLRDQYEEGMYHLTPYASHAASYKYMAEQEHTAKSHTPDSPKWEPSRYNQMIRINSFRWHEGSLANAKTVLGQRSGWTDQSIGVRETNEAEAARRMIAAKHNLPVQDVDCVEPNDP